MNLKSENRVEEIQKHTVPEQWEHFPGTENPADLLTRRQKLEDLQKNENWWKGPKWLLADENE